MFRRLWAIFEKEIIGVWKAPETRFALALPPIALLLFGYAMNMDVKSVSTVVLDLNRDAESRQMVKEFENTGYFKLVGEVDSDQDLEAVIVSGRAKVGIRIPPDYSANLLNGLQGQVQVLVDGSDAATALQILNSSQQFGFLKSLEREGISPAMFSVDVRPQLLFDADLRSAHFFIPGLIGVILQLAAMLLAVFALAHARDAPEPSSVTLVSKTNLVLGKLLPCIAIGFAQTALMLLLMVFLFGVPIHGSSVLLLVLSLVFFASALGVGMVISTICHDQGETMQMSLLFMLAVFLLSGFVFPREAMPPVVYALSLFVPATYYLEILRGIILRGAGIAALWDEAVALAALGIFFAGVSALCLKKRSG